MGLISIETVFATDHCPEPIPLSPLIKGDAKGRGIWCVSFATQIDLKDPSLMVDVTLPDKSFLALSCKRSWNFSCFSSCSKNGLRGCTSNASSLYRHLLLYCQSPYCHGQRQSKKFPWSHSSAWILLKLFLIFLSKNISDSVLYTTKMCLFW